jgi:2-C-methyl-D-erythritol 4-phosphate cytidylyltransferase
LVQKKIYDQGINLLLAGADAVKQQHVVVDTLKVVDAEKIIQTTVDRDLIKALTSPEFYWVESITSVSEDFGWFYKIKVNGKIEYIVGELESTRIRTERDLLLVNALIQQGRLN